MISTFSRGQKRCAYFENCAYFGNCSYFGKWRIPLRSYSLCGIESSIKIGIFVYDFIKIF